mmetsp:Transcript_37676/g.57709  ORF Transcript_37676/g.57709 Transcript_37676/m.57709 type:complete len:84 (-) Transcript_37676:128-379(-)
MSENKKIVSKPGGEWMLRDLKGKKFGSFHFRGHYYLLFFGHTKSPDTAPMTMHKIMKAMRQVKRSKENQYVECVVVFVDTKPD